MYLNHVQMHQVIVYFFNVFESLDWLPLVVKVSFFFGKKWERIIQKQ